MGHTADKLVCLIQIGFPLPFPSPIAIPPPSTPLRLLLCVYVASPLIQSSLYPPSKPSETTTFYPIPCPLPLGPILLSSNSCFLAWLSWLWHVFSLFFICIYKHGTYMTYYNINDVGYMFHCICIFFHLHSFSTLMLHCKVIIWYTSSI